MDTPTPDTDTDTLLDTPTATPPAPEFAAHRALHGAVYRCAHTSGQLPAAGADADRARAMLTALAETVQTAADSLLTDPTLATEPDGAGTFRIVDLVAELVRQECRLLRHVFARSGLDRWPIADRWAEAEALHARALQLAARIPDTVPRPDYATADGCRAISLSRLAVWHSELADAATTIRRAVDAAQDGLGVPTPASWEILMIGEHLAEYAARLADTHAEHVAAQSRALDLPTT